MSLNKLNKLTKVSLGFATFTRNSFEVFLRFKFSSLYLCKCDIVLNDTRPVLVVYLFCDT